MADKKLNIVCEELVSFPVGNGMYQNILFKPTRTSKTAILDAKSFGGYHAVSVKDGGGEHVTIRPHRVLSVKSQRSVFIYTSQEL